MYLDIPLIIQDRVLEVELLSQRLPALDSAPAEHSGAWVV